MKWLAAALVGTVIALTVIGLIQRKDSRRAVEAARTAEDSIAALLPTLEALERSGALVAARMRVVTDSVARDRERLEREADEARADEVVATREVRALRDALRVTLDSAQLRIEDAREAAQQTATRALERRLAISERKVSGLEVELRSVRLWAHAGWDLYATEKALRIQETQRADSWERVANPPLMERVVGSIPTAGFGAVVAVGAACALGALPFC